MIIHKYFFYFIINLSVMQQNIQLAPAYEKCPRHATNDIVLFCLQDTCREVIYFIYIFIAIM
jgi:hypothetical protein